MAENPVGDFGHFTDLHAIGNGAFGTVYRAVDTKFDRTVALKVLHLNLSSDPTFRNRFVREAKAAARVEHPFVTQVFERGEENGQLFLSMRFIEGRDLKTALEETQPDVRTVLDWLVDIATGLDDMHAEGVIHRDIKPANLVVRSQNGKLYIVDFGIAHLVDHTQTKSSQTGTPPYMSPERLDGEIGGAASDIYALGCVAYRMLSGKDRFRGDHRQVAYQQVTKADSDLGLPPAVADAEPVLRRVLAERPEDRYPTAEAFADALLTAIPEAGLRTRAAATQPSARRPAAPPVTPKPAKRVRSRAGLVVALAVPLAFGGAYAVGQAQSPEREATHDATLQAASGPQTATIHQVKLQGTIPKLAATPTPKPTPTVAATVASNPTATTQSSSSSSSSSGSSGSTGSTPIVPKTVVGG